ncbi:DUF5134 domain-containing protein [Amycolatopsis tucumanensis]|uniref:DUF5134 domain-containing protein n=1 Tax=Amycolatopsis tucumanensis TaxID=401106 RepID=A0ABP7IHB4_9PSEU|nr:DUF5134 domain-containing protein [Amycolatopsis tucumanensis]MCF6425710.1 DUF5134 domain-containing protein [Amycolatopsis tucumanensis]
MGELEDVQIPVLVAWSLTVAFALLAVPSVVRLVRLDALTTTPDTRQQDVAELMMVLAMLAMVSPLGGPIPAAGWQAILVLTAGWFLVAALRGRRCCAVHHLVSAAAMLYMITAMPGHGDGPWMAMTPGQLAWPVLALAAIGYFAVDSVRSGILGARWARTESLRDHRAVRQVCRALMGVGMAYMLVSGL